MTWEQREMEGGPRFEDSQALPDFSYARCAELLGLTGIKVDHPGDVDAAWRDAFGADRPVLIEAVVDADVPLLPSFPAGEQKLESFRRGLEHEGAAGEHALNLLDEQAAQERLITCLTREPWLVSAMSKSQEDGEGIVALITSAGSAH